MNVSWQAPLKPDQRSNPVLVSRYLAPLPVVIRAAELAQLFPGDSHQLKTWGRTPGTLRLDPHWIGVRYATPLHIDPKYPRYTHHLIVHASPGFVLRGHDKVETAVVPGAYLVVDTHSPHQLFAQAKTSKWYLAVSLDADAVLDHDQILPVLAAYVLGTPLLTPDVT